KAQLVHRLWRRPDDHVIVIAGLASEQAVADGAADPIGGEIPGRRKRQGRQLPAAHAQPGGTPRKRFSRDWWWPPASRSGTIAATGVGTMPSTARPSRVPTESSFSERKLSLEI